MKHNLTLVTLTADQIAKAKEVNGPRKRITHALICGPYGQRFGTEKQCLKYFNAWDPAYRIEIAPGRFKAIFPDLFDKAVKTDKFDIADYESTWDLTMKLLKASESMGRKTKDEEEYATGRPANIQYSTKTETKKQRGFWRGLFSR